MTESELSRLNILGVDVTDLSMEEAVALVEQRILAGADRTASIFFVNANTLNLACRDEAYRRVLGSADQVFGDGTGVRWAARWLHRTRLRGNVNGTDLVPRLFEDLAGRGYRYFMLGNTEAAIERSAEHARDAFPGWELAGWHHGYIDPDDCKDVVDQINAAQPDLLLVGMGNPKQEQWIAANRDRLKVPLCMGIGGLLTYWSGDIERAAPWVRAIGFEWLHLLLLQPHKLGRYLIGNPLFLLRLLLQRPPGAALPERAGRSGPEIGSGS